MTLREIIAEAAVRGAAIGNEWLIADDVLDALAPVLDVAWLPSWTWGCSDFTPPDFLEHLHDRVFAVPEPLHVAIAEWEPTPRDI